MAIRKFLNGAVDTFVTADVPATPGSGQTIPVDRTTGWPTPGSGEEALLVLSADDPTRVELATYTGKTANSFTGVTRAVDGTSVQLHVAGKLVTHRASATDLEVGANAISKALGTEKGQLIGFSASGTPVIVPKASADGKILKSLAAGTGGFEWGADVGIGDLLDWQLLLQGSTSLISSQTTLQNTDLTFPIGANHRAAVTAVVSYETPAAADIKLTVIGPAGASGVLTGLGLASSASSAEGDVRAKALNLGSELFFGGIGTSSLTVVIHASVRNGGTAGNVTLQFAQNVSDAGDTRFLVDSFMLYRRGL